jgi:hypothetical protein
MTITDFWLIAATVAGPILAVQAQKFIERARERRSSRLDIFYTLMANRATPLAPARIQALNRIDLEFRPNKLGYQSPNAKAVATAWRTLLDELNQGITATETNPALIAGWTQRCDDRAVDLLFELSKALGFKFSKVDIKRGIYYPRGHVELEAAQHAVLANLNKLLAGQQSLPMRVTEFPTSEEAFKLQNDVQRELLKAFSGDAELHVSMTQRRGKSAE